MATLRRNTELLRRTVSQTPRVIVGPETGALETAERCIEVHVPEGVTIALAIGPHPEAVKTDPEQGAVHGVDDAGARPSDITDGRVHQWPELSGGQSYTFTIRAGQWLTAAAHEGLAHLAVSVQYLVEI